MPVVTKRQLRAATKWLERLEDRTFCRCGPSSYHVVVLQPGEQYDRDNGSDPYCPLHESSVTIVVYEPELSATP